MPRNHTPYDATDRRHAGRVRRRPGHCARILAGVAAVALSLPGVAAGGDRVLFRGAADLQVGGGEYGGFRVGEGGAFAVQGEGTGGGYVVEFSMEEREA